MDEIQIKAKVVGFLYKNDPSFILACEVPFAYGSRRADIVSLYEKEATAFEIKSVGDKVSRLDYQLESYKKFFDYCYVVCEVENLKIIRKSIEKRFGIITVSSNQVKIIRKATRFKRLDRELLASILSTVELRKIAKNKLLRSKHDLCRYVAKHSSTDEIYRASRNQMLRRYSPAMDLLRSEVIASINPDDIQTITRKAPSNISL